MKGILSLLIGLYSIGQVVYYLVNCPSIDCGKNIFGFDVSGIIFLLFWGLLAVVDFYAFFKGRRQNKNIS